MIQAQADWAILLLLDSENVSMCDYRKGSYLVKGSPFSSSYCVGLSETEPRGQVFLLPGTVIDLPIRRFARFPGLLSHWLLVVMIEVVVGLLLGWDYFCCLVRISETALGV
jgi:hypothetical protein